MTKQIIIALLISALSNGLLAQNMKQDSLFSVAQLRTDFIFYRTKVTANNPNLYEYTSKDSLESAFDKLQNGITKPMTANEFYRYISQVNPYVKDGHNYILPSQKLQDYYGENALYFPINFVIYDQKLYVTLNLSDDTTLNIGDEITSINNRKAIDLIDEMANLMSRDCDNMAYPYFVIQNYFRSYYGFFYGFKKEYLLTIKNNSGVEKNIKIEAIPFSQISERRKTNPIKRFDAINYDKAIYWVINKEKDYTIFTIKNWHTSDVKKIYNQNIQKEIRKFFKELESNSTSHLIIDLRGNQGGDGLNGIYFLRHIMQENFRYCHSVKAYNKKGKLVDAGPRLTKEYSPFKNNYKGQVYVLIDGGSFSNSGIFSEVIQKYKRATLIGSQTGGNAIKLTGGRGFLEMPNTKIMFLKATHQHIISDLPNTGRGAIPDIEIKPTLQELIDNFDAVLNFAIKRIENGETE